MLLAISISIFSVLALCVYRIKLAGDEAYAQFPVLEVEPRREAALHTAEAALHSEEPPPVQSGLQQLSSAVNALSPLPETAQPAVSAPDSVLVS
jgi:hypothetical protein